MFKLSLMKLFLDDVRDPEHCCLYMNRDLGKLSLIYLEEWYIVRNYHRFVMALAEFGKDITHVSFDHDLGEDEARELNASGVSKRKARAAKKLIKSGYDCAVFLKNYYKNKNIPLPIMFCHSMNPIGKENIINLFKDDNITR